MNEEELEINVAVMNDCMDKIYEFILRIENDFGLDVTLTSMHYFIISNLKKNGISLEEFIKQSLKMWVTHELDN